MDFFLHFFLTEFPTIIGFFAFVYCQFPGNSFDCIVGGMAGIIFYICLYLFIFSIFNYFDYFVGGMVGEYLFFICLHCQFSR